MLRSRTLVALRLVLVFAVLAGGVSVAAVPTVLAAGDAELLRGAEVIELPPVSYDVRSGTAKRELIQGEKVGGTCRFTMSFQATDGDLTPQMAKMIAFDPETCLAEIERGEPVTLP
jgi:hypothetical protein